MLQVVVAGLIALASKWLLDGGIRRRDRHVIREELELADLLGDRPEAERLRTSAERRLERYLRPPLTKRIAPALRSAAMFLVALTAALVALTATTDENTPESKMLVGALIFGALAAVFAIVLQNLVDGLLRLRATRARMASARRTRDSAGSASRIGDR